MKVSVVVPVFNAAGTIARTLAALASQDLDAEVIVVDGGSDDGTRQILSSSGVTVVDNPERDPASARNLGARTAGGDVLAFTDADCQPEPGWLAAGLRALEHAELVQGRVVPDGPVGPFDRTVSVGAEHGLYETANLFVTRAAFERAGGFSAVDGVRLNPGTHFGEDTWFAWRCKRAGAVSAFAPDAVVRHAVFPRTAGEYVAERARAAHFPALVAAVPELRRAFLHHNVFLSPASARFDLALLGLATRRRIGLLAAVPYAVDVVRDTRRRGTGPAYATARVAADAVTCAALARGTARTRTIVL